jgi:hypothetical protein
MNLNPAPDKELEMADKGGEEDAEFTGGHTHNNPNLMHVAEDECAMADDTRTVYLD